LGLFLVSVIVNYMRGQYTSVLSGFGWTGISILAALLVYFLIAAIRAPFVVIERHHRAIAEGRMELEALYNKVSAVVIPPISAAVVLDAVEERYALERLEPNVRPAFNGTLVEAYEGDNEVITEGVLEGARTFQALVLAYHNELTGPRSAGKPRAIDKVSARLGYLSFDDNPNLSIPRGHWLSETNTVMNFGKNDLHYLIIAVLEGDDVFAVERRFDGVHPNGTTKFKPITGSLFRVNVRLIAESEVKVISTCDVMLEIKREPNITLQLTSRVFWRLEPVQKMIDEGFDLISRMYELKKADRFKDEAKDQYVQEVRDWEARAANFIGLHWSEKEKTAFLNSYPSIEIGLKDAHRHMLIPRIGLPGQPVIQDDTPPLSLHDTIMARIKKMLSLCQGTPLV